MFQQNSLLTHWFQQNSLLTLTLQGESKIENEDSDKKDSSSRPSSSSFFSSSSSSSPSYTNGIGSGNPSFANLDVAMCSNLDSMMPVTSSLIASGTEGVLSVRIWVQV